MIYPFQNNFAETLLCCSSTKKICIKSWAFLVEGVLFLRKMSDVYLFCLLLSPEEGNL